ncbi:hypothetical protein Scep_021401 [Stephania cephalantha]|uniref:Uncharacterized protein n=1 Tax=Stephania cephalantha TaxID=152367 RepID=A0AAP0F627_9MAGN
MAKGVETLILGVLSLFRDLAIRRMAGTRRSDARRSAVKEKGLRISLPTRRKRMLSAGTKGSTLRRIQHSEKDLLEETLEMRLLGSMIKV